MSFLQFKNWFSDFAIAHYSKHSWALCLVLSSIGFPGITRSSSPSSSFVLRNLHSSLRNMAIGALVPRINFEIYLLTKCISLKLGIKPLSLKMPPCWNWSIDNYLIVIASNYCPIEFWVTTILHSYLGFACYNYIGLVGNCSMRSATGHVATIYIVVFGFNF